MNNICINAYKNSKHKDENGEQLVVCQKTGDICIAQRYCTNESKYIVSERANVYCKDYNK